MNKLKALLCGFKDIDGELNSQNEWNYQIAEIQHKQQKTKRHASEASSENFSSSRYKSLKTELNAVDSIISSGPTLGTRLTASLSDLSTTIVVETLGRSRARRPRTPTCRAAGMETDFLKFEIYDYLRRNDSQGSNLTQSTNTWRMSRSIVSGDFNNSIARTGSGYSDKFSALTQVTKIL